MKRNLKRVFRIGATLLGSILILILALITFAVNFVFTPEKITPVVTQVANRTLNAKLQMESVELTFFSTFPKFGLKINEGNLISHALNDSVFCRNDSLLSFKKCIATVNPLAYLRENKIIIYNLKLIHPTVYAFRNTQGKANWDIVRAGAGTLPEKKNPENPPFENEIDIRNIELKQAYLTFDDRNTQLYARIDSANLQIKAALTKKNSSLYLKFDNKNIIFWQKGELLLNRIAASMQTDISVNRQTLTWTFKDTELTLNGIRLDAGGTAVRDTVGGTLSLDLIYGLHAPSVETILKMIPESYVQKKSLTAKGEVTAQGTLKGIYGNGQLPEVTLKIQIKDAMAKYAGLPYGIDHFSADFYAYIDLMRRKPSYMDLKIFRLKGAHTEILANGKIEDLFTDPLITFQTRSQIDMDALAKTFPLQAGVTIGGKLGADLQIKCRLSSLKKQDIGRMKIKGKLDLKEFKLTDASKNFDFSSQAIFTFSDDKYLEAQIYIKDLLLRSRRISSDIRQMSLKAVSEIPRDSTQIIPMECTLTIDRLQALSGDTLKIYSNRTSGKLWLKPGKKDISKPLLHLSARTDSLFMRAHQSRLSLDVAGFDLEAEKVRDSIWQPKGIIGFNKLRLRTAEFALPIRIQKTAVTLGDKNITLKNAVIRLGKSNLTASGSVSNLYGALTKNENLKGRLDITSGLINCNQLINALSFPQDTVEIENDTIPSDMRLFVIPQNIDFELHTDLKKVIFDKMLFENVQGNIDIKNQTVYLKDLRMKALDADMQATMVYRARSSRGGYAGFDFNIRNINVAKLVDFIPSLDTIVPMLRSFKGKVQFDVAAESRLDSALNIKIPSLKSAIHIQGDSLVLMDGETFAEISKMLMFKNKKENVFDSIAVNIVVNDGNVVVYPFLVEIDRYKAAVGGRQGLDMNFSYHISILKSPIPFKMGINITGNLDKTKIRLGKAKYKNAITPTETHKVDSTRLNVKRSIISRFRRIAAPRTRL